MASEEESPAIGNYLGTTYSCVAVWQRDRVGDNNQRAGQQNDAYS